MLELLQHHVKSLEVGMILVEALRPARIAMGGVAPKPWRARQAEDALIGETPGDTAFTRVADIALSGATTRPGNAFKPELARRTIVAVLQDLAKAS